MGGPELRRGWLASTKEAFAAYSSDQVAVSPSVGALVVRYFDLADEHTRALRDVRKERHTTGSMGQLVMSPSAGYLVQLENAMQKLEQSLGISPQARSRMKLEAASTEATLDRIFAGPEAEPDRRARGGDGLIEPEPSWSNPVPLCGSSRPRPAQQGLPRSTRSALHAGGSKGEALASVRQYPHRDRS